MSLWLIFSLSNTVHSFVLITFHTSLIPTACGSFWPSPSLHPHCHPPVQVTAVVQSLSLAQPPVTPPTAARQASLSFTISQSLLKLMSIESVMPSYYLILCHPFSCLQSFPASGSFPMSWLFTSGGQTIGVLELQLQ